MYSYGMVLWEMTTMKKPFDGMGRDQFFAEVVRGSNRPPINKKCPKSLSELMQVGGAGGWVEGASVNREKSALRFFFFDCCGGRVICMPCYSLGLILWLPVSPAPRGMYGARGGGGRLWFVACRGRVRIEKEVVRGDFFFFLTLRRMGKK